MKVYLLNGPPRSGKDTAGSLMHGVTVLKLANVLKAATHGIVGRLTENYNILQARPDAYESRKDVISDDFLGLSPRDWYIGVSERLIKPLLGDNFFGKHVAKSIKSLSGILGFPDRFAVTDCGFAPEVAEIASAVGAENCTIIQLRRKGCTFAGDSRSYVEVPGVRTVVIHNDGTLEELRIALEKVCQTT